MATMLGMIVTYLNWLLLLKSHYPLTHGFARPCEKLKLSYFHIPSGVPDHEVI